MNLSQENLILPPTHTHTHTHKHTHIANKLLNICRFCRGGCLCCQLRGRQHASTLREGPIIVRLLLLLLLLLYATQILCCCADGHSYPMLTTGWRQCTAGHTSIHLHPN
jgi:hypothetical protein